MTRVAALILAAGDSSRLGEPKQLALLGGESLLERAVRVAHAAQCVPVLVVLGASAETVRAQCKLVGARVVLNPDWQEGMGSSIRAGIRVLLAPELQPVDAVILMTCDQPAVTSSHLCELAALAVSTPAASAYVGRRGVPACFPASYFSELSALQGDAGARRLLATAQAIELPGGELDIDTPASLHAARALYS